MNGRRSRHYEQHLKVMAYNGVEIQRDAAKFLKAHMFTERLRKYQLELTMQEYSDIRKQALDGDIEGAEKKLREILGNKSFRGVI